MGQFLANAQALRAVVQDQTELRLKDTEVVQAGQLFIEDTGGQYDNQEPNINHRIMRASQTLVLLNNMYFDTNEPSVATGWKIENQGEGGVNRSASMVEVGQEGVSIHTIPNGPPDSNNKVKRFLCRATLGGVVVIGNGYPNATPTPSASGGVENWLGVNCDKDKNLNRPLEANWITTATTGNFIPARLIVQSSGSVTDGAGCNLEFAIQGSATTETVYARCGGYIDGGTTNGSFVIFCNSSGTMTERMRVKPNGDVIVPERLVVGVSAVTGADFEVIHDDTATAPSPAVSYMRRNTALFSGSPGIMRLVHHTTQSANDTYGTSLELAVNDAALRSGGFNETVALRISTVRDGGVRTYDTVFSVPQEAPAAEAMRIKAEKSLQVVAGLGLHGKTPPAQAAAIADVPTAGSATAAANATAINSILAALRDIGIIAT